MELGKLTSELSVRGKRHCSVLCNKQLHLSYKRRQNSIAALAVGWTDGVEISQALAEAVLERHPRGSPIFFTSCLRRIPPSPLQKNILNIESGDLFISALVRRIERKIAKFSAWPVIVSREE